MSLFYNIAYRIGFRPWERAATYPAAARQIEALLDQEESEHFPPYGKALDIGCGTGLWSFELERRGWDVTGVDLVGKAIQIARRRAQQAGVEIEFVQSDATALRAAGIKGDFSFVWDFGMIHGLDPLQRVAVAREVTAVSAKDATMLIMAWLPGRRGPLPRGMDLADIESAFSDWSVIQESLLDATGLPRPLRKVRPCFYRLRRR